MVRWQPHDGRIRGFGFDASGQRLATASEDGFVKVWDISTLGDGDPTLLDRIPAGFPSDVVWVGEDRLAFFPAFDGRIQFESVDPAQLAHRALSLVSRGPTAVECETYALDPCPTLEEMRGR